MTKDYGDKRAVEELSFSVRPGIVTGFLGPNGSGKSTTMRLILGLDAPTAGDVTVNGKHYRDHASPLHEVGALLEARSVHTGRSAYNHLLALAQTRDPAQPRRRVGRSGWPARRRAQACGQFSLGMGQRLGIAAALLGILDRDARRARERPRSGGHPLDAKPSEGPRRRRRTVFVSSHLMSEMALTADHLIVIGRGRLIADASTEEFLRHASTNVVRVRSPRATELAALLAGPGDDACARAGSTRCRGSRQFRSGTRPPLMGSRSTN